MTMQTSSMGSMGSPDNFSRERFEKGNHKDLKTIVDWAEKQFTSIKNSRTQLERQWKINLAFYFGKQNVVFKTSGGIIPGQSGTLYEPPAPYWRSRPVINRIRPTIRSEISKLTAQRPSATIVPNSNEDFDLYAARAGEQIWDSTYRQKNLKAVFRRAVFWSQVCGTGFIKTWWDPKAIDQQSNQMGDLRYIAETPFHVFIPDLREETLEGQPFVMHAQIVPKESIELQYPGLPLSNASGREEILEDQYLNLIGANNPSASSTVMRKEIWVKPGAYRLFPGGAVFTVIGDTLVDLVEGQVFHHGKYPFDKVSHIPVGSFYGASTITDLLPIQREYNRTRGQIIENKNRMAKIQLVAPAGSIDPRKITTEPGQVIEYTPGFDPPQPMPLSGLPAYVIQELDRLLMDMADISGIHEVSKGGVPPGVTAATAISYLQEQDESMMAHTFDSFEEAIEGVAFKTLSLISQFWDTQRVVKIVGVDGSFEAKAFKGADLRGNTDIRVEGGSSLPTSKAAKQAFIMDLMKMGFIPPEKGLEVMEIGGINKIYDEVQTDVREAQRENLKMMQVTEEQIAQHEQLIMGMMQMDPMSVIMPQDGKTPVPPQDPQGQPQLPLIVPVNNWNNDRVHIEIHNKQRKSQAFDDAPPHIKQLFDQHVKHHVDKIVQGQLAQVPQEVTDSMQQGGMDPFSQGALQESQANEQEGAEQPPGAGGGSNGIVGPQPGAAATPNGA